MFVSGLLIGHFAIPKGNMPSEDQQNGQSEVRNGASKGGNGGTGETTSRPKPGLSLSQVTQRVHDEVKTENLRKNLRSVLSHGCCFRG